MTSRQRFLSAVLLLSSSVLGAAEKPLIVAHYMAWFGLPEVSGSWYNWKFNMGGVDVDKHHYPDLTLSNGRRDIAAAHYPSIGPYDSADPHLAEYHILLAKEAGVDAFVVNWYGFEDENGQRRQEDRGFENLLRAAERLDFRVCLNYDDKASFPPYQRTKTRAEAVGHARLVVERILRDYAVSPAYLKIDGKAALSNFASPYAGGGSSSMDLLAFSADEWRQIFGAARSRLYFIHDHHWGWNKSVQQAGFHQVADSVYCWIGRTEDRQKFLRESQALQKSGRLDMVSGVANPGFDNTPCWGWGGGLIKIDRRGGDEYREQFEDSLAHGSGFVQLVTWNDFTEGSTIEPTEEYGDRYLKITAEIANRWTPGAPLGKDFDVPKRLYGLRQRVDRLERSGQADPAVLGEARDLLAGAVESFRTHDRGSVDKTLDQTDALLAQEEKSLPQAKRMEVSLAHPPSPVYAGESIELVARVANPLKEAVPVYLEVDRAQVPRSWLGDLEQTVWLQPGEKREVRFPVRVPSDAKDRVGWFTVTADCPYAPATSNVVHLKVIESFVRSDVGPVNLLPAGAPQKLALTVDVRRKEAVTAEVTLAATGGWTPKPARLKVKLPPEGRVTAPFTLTPPARAGASGVLTLTMSYEGETQVVKEPYAVLPAAAPGLLKGDVNQDGFEDYVLGNEAVEFLCTPAVGGRMLAFINRATGHNQFFLDYPRVKRTAGDIWQKWAEYGGVNDWFPTDWPGNVWNNDWKVRKLPADKGRAAVAFYSETPEGLVIEREMSVDARSPRVRVKYELKNLSNQPQSLHWSSHPDIAPGGDATGDDVMVVPHLTEKGVPAVAKKLYAPRLEKSHYRPSSEGWMMGYDKGRQEFIGQTFDAKLVDKIGLWEGTNFFTMELLFPQVSLPPRTKRSFTVHYVTGQGSLDAAIQQLRKE